MHKIFLFGCFLLTWFGVISQDDSIIKYDKSTIDALEITQEDLQQYLDDEKFNYEVVKTENTWWDGVKNWFYNLFRRLFEWLFGVEEAVGYLASFLRIVPYILLALLLFLIIRFFIKANTRAMIYSKENPNLVTLSEEERIIKTEDIQQLIQEALAKKNYRLAVRYYYLSILKLLSERELIDWQLQKTNDDYISELSESSLKAAFSKATLLYDYVWYGEFHIGQERYNNAELIFESLKSKIATNA